MSDSIIKSPGQDPRPKGVESDIDKIGKGNATPIDGHDVVLTVPMSELKERS